MNQIFCNVPPKVHLANRDAEQYAATNSLRLHPAQAALIDLTKRHPYGVMIGDSCVLQHFQLLLRAINAKRYLEVGTYTGCSALAAALAMPPDGMVITLDMFECLVDLGRPFWKQAGVDKKIETRIGLAKDTLSELIAEGQAGTFDFAFIDADKGNYDDYYEKCLQLVRRNGIIALDNVLWRGSVYKPSGLNTDSETLALKKFNEKLHTDDRIHLSMLTVADGVTFALKK